MMYLHRPVLGFSAFLLAAALPSPVLAAVTFSDVPGDHPAYEAITALKDKGILQGYDDGTFRPDDIVNRAAAVKVIVSSVLGKDSLNDRDKSAFSDVPDNVWFLPYVEYARVKLAIIDGPPKRTAFEGNRSVTRAEFIKMLLLANKTDPNGAYSEVTAPLALDVKDSKDWFYPYMRFALSASMTQVSSKGNLNPNLALDRGSMAILMYRFLQYQDHKRMKDLLANADDDGAKVINFLEKGNDVEAGMAATRATIATRGALQSSPDEPIVKGAVKITEALQLIVQAYRTAATGKYDDVIDKCKQAWDLGAAAEEFSPTLKIQAQQVQMISGSLADQARALKK